MNFKFSSFVALLFFTCILSGCNPPGELNVSSDDSNNSEQLLGNGDVASNNTEQDADEPEVIVEPEPEACATCGTVSSIRAVEADGDSSGVGAVIGGVVGGLLGNQVGGGSGKKVATVAGAVGGAFAGNEIEKNKGKVTYYEVNIAMNDGSKRVINVPSLGELTEGMDVEVIGNEIHMR